MTFITNPRVGQLLDRATRGILTYPRILRETVRVFEPALEACFDFERSVLLPREFTLFDWRIREGDLPLLTPFRADPTAAWINVLVWIEHQTQSHSFMPLRSLVYGTLHWEVAWKEWEQLPTPKPALRVSALFPIVLYFGGSRWTSSRNLREVVNLPLGWPGPTLEWEPRLWDLARFTPDALLEMSGPWPAVLALVRSLEASLPEWRRAYRLATERTLELPDEERVLRSDLLWYALSYVGRRRGETEAREMMAVTQEMAPSATLLADVRAVSEGVQRSWFEDMYHQGEIQAWQKSLGTLIQRRFGAVPEALAEAIRTCQDEERLEAAVALAAEVPTLAEFHL